VAATSPKAELLGDYDKESIGLQARAISKGMRKITGVIGQTNSLLICLNQIRTKVGVMYGDPTTTPGGKAIPFHSSIRIKLGAGQPIKDGDDVIGINVSAKTIKNKVAPPFRVAKFQIHFGKGIVEHEELFDLLRKHGEEIINNKSIKVAGSGQWKNFQVVCCESGEVLIEKKFRKTAFNEIMKDPDYKPYLDQLVEKAMVKVMTSTEGVDIDAESLAELEALQQEMFDGE
jgi:protein RecA